MKPLIASPYRVCTLVALAATSVLLAFGPEDGGLVEVAGATVEAEWISGSLAVPEIAAPLAQKR